MTTPEQELTHLVVSQREYWIARLLRRSPRVFCGEPDPGPEVVGGPYCPSCVAGYESAYPAPKPLDDGYTHIVGWWQGRMSRLLRRVPRSLCGELVIGTPETDGVMPDDPLCPACLERSGCDPETDLTPVPGYRL